ncbi:Riboflavin biosynthesis protein RibBA [uncultured archaeon]|nr:Riboflavin biosynthesis protein RibBA [uncultured archaeon]
MDPKTKTPKSNSGRAAPCPCHHMNLRRVAKTVLPTKYGQFSLWAYQETAGGRKGGPKAAPDGPTHLALFVGHVEGAARVPVRLHSECVTGDALGSLRCDCGPQLEKAMRMIQAQERGVLIHLDQEGRGIGLANKMKAYALQDEGLDTVEANLKLGFVEDKRDYSAAACILRDLGVKSVLLITNNPKKVEGLQKCGMDVEGRLPLLTPPNPNNALYLQTKKKKMGHLLE